jgi:DNA repair protein REV1
MRKLGAEVSSRLKAIDMKGRLLTLKILKRHPDAPIEAPKFMGHGICETFSKSAQVIDTTGGATNDPDILGDAAWDLLKSFGFDPTELRGLGLQVTKLEGKDGLNPTSPGEKLEDGQMRLQFKPSAKTESAKRPSESDGVSSSSPVIASITAEARATESAKSDDPLNQKSKRSPLNYEDVSEATVDLEVLEALPLDIREEILAQMKLRGAAGIATEGTENVPTGPAVNVASTSAVKLDQLLNIASTAAVAAINDAAIATVQDVEDDPDIVIIESPPNRDSEPPSASKSREKGKERETGYKTPKTGHIARQLQPKTKLMISPMKNTLFTKKTAVQVTNDELEELDIDPEVFFQLPLDIQKDQLANARNEHQRKSSRSGGKGRFGFGSGLGNRTPFQSDPDNGIGIWHKGGPMKNAFHSRFSRSPSVMAPPPSDVEFVAVYPEKFAVTLSGNNGSDSSSSITLTDMAEIQTHVKRWVMACQKKGLGPCSEDVEGIKDWLVRCMAQEGTESGMEKAVIVARWWRSLLRTYWAAEEKQTQSQDPKKDKDKNQQKKLKEKTASNSDKRTSPNPDPDVDLDSNTIVEGKQKATIPTAPPPGGKNATEDTEVQAVEDHNEEVSIISPGVAWWTAFRSCKSAMDEASKKRFGGKVSL